MVVQEGHRNPRALVSAGMVIQMLQEGNDFEQTIASLPMAPTGSQKAADDVERYLARTPEQRRRYGPTKAAGDLMDREMAVIEVWVRTLNIYAGEDSEKSVEQQLFDEIRRRMYQLYFRRAQVSAHE